MYYLSCNTLVEIRCLASLGEVTFSTIPCGLWCVPVDSLFVDGHEWSWKFFQIPTALAIWRIFNRQFANTKLCIFGTWETRLNLLKPIFDHQYWRRRVPCTALNPKTGIEAPIDIALFPLLWNPQTCSFPNAVQTKLWIRFGWNFY